VRRTSARARDNQRDPARAPHRPYRPATSRRHTNPRIRRSRVCRSSGSRPEESEWHSRSASGVPHRGSSSMLHRKCPPEPSHTSPAALILDRGPETGTSASASPPARVIGCEAQARTNRLEAMNGTREITAVVLSIGAPPTARAVDSVRRQSLPVRDIVLVEGVTPFHRALNTGAASVTTPFFVQIDADMVLDEDCIERLAACLTDGVGLVTGFLRDPLYERIEAIKLFRTECVRRRPFRDSPSPDTDFAAEIARAGWSDVYALPRRGVEPSAWHTFGDHDPGYTPLYTYAKHIVEGRRLRYRKNAAGLQHLLRYLQSSAHPAALVASIALAHGVFLDRDGDLLDRYAEDAPFLRL